MEIKPEDDSSSTSDGYMNTIISFTSKRIGYLAVVIIIGGSTLWFAAPYASEVFSYKSNIDEIGKISSENVASLKTLWSEFSTTRSQVDSARLQMQFDERTMAQESPADAVRDEQLREIDRRLDKLEAVIEQLKEKK